MSYAMYLRHKFQLLKDQIYLKLIYFMEFQLLLLYLFCIKSERISVSFSYFAGSFVALVLYSIREKNSKFYKNLN